MLQFDSSLTKIETFQEAFYVHINFLWGLVTKKAVPSVQTNQQMLVFYQRFLSSNKLDGAVEQSPNLLAFEPIETLKKDWAEQNKIGKHMVQISKFNTKYHHFFLSKLGLVAWCPNIDKQVYSLYNKAHRICAIKTFCQLVVGKAYKYMNVNDSYNNNFDLLKKVYNHYVH